MSKEFGEQLFNGAVGVGLVGVVLNVFASLIDDDDKPRPRPARFPSRGGFDGLNGTSITGASTLQWLVEMEGDGDVDLSFDDLNTLIAIADRFEDAARDALATCYRQQSGQSRADADDVADDLIYDGEGAYAVLMTLRGEGVGIWDGRWDYQLNPAVIRRLVPCLQNALSGWADSTGGGAFNDALRDAADGNLGSPGDYIDRALGGADLFGADLGTPGWGPVSAAQLTAHVARVQRRFDDPRMPLSGDYIISAMRGRKHARIVKTMRGNAQARSVVHFVDMTTGQIRRAASWKRPVPGGGPTIHAEIGGADLSGADLSGAFGSVLK
jgi:hypothetical protein